VDVDPETPVALRHHLRGVGDDRHPSAGDVRAVDLAFTDVEDEGDTAVVVGGPVVERQVARAHERARTGLEVASGHGPRHDDSPPVTGSSLSLLDQDRQADPAYSHERLEQDAEVWWQNGWELPESEGLEREARECTHAERPQHTPFAPEDQPARERHD